MQLVDSHLHWRFGEHLRAHVEYQTRLDNISRHVCGWLVTKIKIRVCLIFSSDALTRLRLSSVLCRFIGFADFYKRLSDAISATGLYLNDCLPDVI